MSEIGTYQIKIGGMHCASCAQRLQKALTAKKGIGHADVNFSTETATVQFDISTTDFKEIKDVIEKNGFSVKLSRILIAIGGMHCAMCAVSVKKALLEIPEVAEVTVNPSTATAALDLFTQTAPVQLIKKKIKRNGYSYDGIIGADDAGVQGEKYRHEQRMRIIRMAVSFGVSIPLMIMMYIPTLHHSLNSFWSFLLSTPVFIFVAYPIYHMALINLGNKALTMDVMYALGISTAYGASVAGTFGLLPTHEFILYETAIMLSGFLILGRFLESNAKGKTSQSIRKLIDLQPKNAAVIKDGKEITIPVENIEAGDHLIVRPGEQIPVDGKVIKGESSIDESMISGEPLPVYKTAGSFVTAGTLNKSGVVYILSERIGKDTILAKIIKLVRDAQSSRPPVQLFADRVVSVFIPVILGLAITAFLIWFLVIGSSLVFALTVMIAVVVIACPCALGLASPTAVTVGIGRGAELGILIKNGDVLEKSETITTVVFDKTGTLTIGKPAVQKVYTSGIDTNEFLTLAASVEKNSIHPLAEAIVVYAKESGCEIKPVESFHTYEGKGVKAVIDGREVLLGNEQFLIEEGLTLTDEISRFAQSQYLVSHVFVSINNTIAGMISVADTLRDDAAMAVEALKNMGLEVIMVTGDKLETARYTGLQIGISDVIAGVLPHQKADKIKDLQVAGKKVAFVGDGINDAPALALADIGIAIGSGTDIAIETGEIVLVKNDLKDVVASIQMGRKIIRQIKLNIFWAFAYNSALIPLAAGVLKPWLGLMFKPELAGLAMAMSSVTVVSFSLLLRKYVPEIYRT
jgi:Cu+-exporting ATPase